ncbi:RBBP9/YdeN family alpha/beta hydrolase [Dactylosporangium sp. CA-052675]|uniref:RBBP9/YdeN family alpha/beta hydrolase n=1 Tax=Dactylosporangium sp. CA-052675 TaxID=3239927 RepID=UPI003D8CF118
MTRFLLVPGRGRPYPAHWSRRWAEDYPEFSWAPEPPGPPYVAEDRVAALDAAIGSRDEPAVLVAHSAGCLTVAIWASRHTGPVRAAMLVTPPWLDPEWDGPSPGFVCGPVPRDPLPFPALVVASRDDPAATFEQAAALARDWGAELFDAGPVGHLDSRSGFGPWPEGERLARTLAARAAKT